MASLSAVGRAVNSVLTLDEVLDVIVAGATDLLDARTGFVRLVDHDVAHSPGRLSVPLVNRGDVFGFLTIEAEPEREFSEDDERALALFAEHAAIAIANARLHERERAQLAEFVELDRIKSEFVATVSHELRTPLTSILGSVRTLQRQQLPKEQVELFLSVIERQGRRLLGLIEELLVAQRTQQGLDLRCRPVDIVQAVGDLVAMMRSGGRDVSLRAPAEAVAHADREALDQIVFNLVENAFTHGGEPVEVVVEDGTPDHPDAVRLAVLDRGPGVEAKESGQIFERFARGSEAHRVAGMGLGLYLVRSMAEAQGGSVHVEPRPGGGAVFEVLLPRMPGGVMVADAGDGVAEAVSA
jgi:K+-sensing histidine kinase KdpD